MELWANWVDAIVAVFVMLSSNVGLGEGLAVIALTVALRLVVLPVTWSMGYRGQMRQRKLETLQPRLEQAKQRYSNDPRRYAARVLELYGEHGMKPFDGRSIFGALVQMPIVLGMFHALRQGLSGERFLWVRDLAKPDLSFALLAALSTSLLMVVAPEMPEQMRLLMLVVPAFFMLLAALHFSSGIALYWTTSNVFSAVQTLILRWVIVRRTRAEYPAM